MLELAAVTRVSIVRLPKGTNVPLVTVISTVVVEPLVKAVLIVPVAPLPACTTAAPTPALISWAAIVTVAVAVPESVLTPVTLAEATYLRSAALFTTVLSESLRSTVSAVVFWTLAIWELRTVRPA